MLKKLIKISKRERRIRNSIVSQQKDTQDEEINSSLFLIFFSPIFIIGAIFPEFYFGSKYESWPIWLRIIAGIIGILTGAFSIIIHFSNNTTKNN